MDDQAARECVARVEAVLGEVESLPDPAARERAAAVAQALVDMYGEGLARIVAMADGARDAFVADELVAHLLLAHDLHPVPVEERVRGALEEVRPYLASHGAEVELVGTGDGVARLRLSRDGSGCASPATLTRAIEDAVQKAAPDIAGVQTDDLADPPPVPVIQLQMANRGAA